MQKLSKTFPPPIHSSDPELSLGKGSAPQSLHWPRAVWLRLNPEPLCSRMNSTFGGSFRTSSLIGAGGRQARHRLRLRLRLAQGGLRESGPHPGEAGWSAGGRGRAGQVEGQARGVGGSGSRAPSCPAVPCVLTGPQSAGRPAGRHLVPSLLAGAGGSAGGPHSCPPGGQSAPTSYRASRARPRCPSVLKSGDTVA